MEDTTIAQPAPKGNDEDYTGAVCWAIYSQRQKRYIAVEALVDVEDFERIGHLPWRIYRVGKCRLPRVVRNEAYESCYLAREIMGFPEGQIVDHRNRNTLDDRRRNLRTCSVAQNNLNSPGQRHCHGLPKGVFWLETRRKWRVIAAGYLIGHFEDRSEAIRAYNRYVRHHVGEFAYLNPV